VQFVHRRHRCRFPALAGEGLLLRPVPFCLADRYWFFFKSELILCLALFLVIDALFFANLSFRQLLAGFFQLVSGFFRFPLQFADGFFLFGELQLAAAC